MPVAISRFPLRRSVAVLAALLPLAFGVSARAVDEPVALDLIIEGGTIFTGDDAPPPVNEVLG
jgi:N-acyl-D-amino-acid deacylase